MTRQRAPYKCRTCDTRQCKPLSIKSQIRRSDIQKDGLALIKKYNAIIAKTPFNNASEHLITIPENGDKIKLTAHNISNLLFSYDALMTMPEID